MRKEIIPVQNELAILLTHLQKLENNNGNLHPVEFLHELAVKLKTDQFYLAVLGQFKRGKTTFLNALLGANVLPVSVVPLTSIITVVRYGELPGIRVYFKKGEIHEFPPDRLVDYVTETGNPKNQKGVLYTEVFYRSDYLQQGICLIDTPGVGSIFEHNTETTNSFLPKIDAGIFLLSGDSPVSEEELKFLQKIRKYAPKIFFILNKIDYLSSKELEDSSHFIKTVLEKAFPDTAVHIYPVSSRMALEGKQENDRKKLAESRFPEFEQELNTFSNTEKSSIFLISIINDVRDWITDKEFALDLALRAVELPLEELERKLEQLKIMRLQYSKEKEDIFLLWKGLIEQQIQHIGKEISRFQEKETPILVDEFLKQYKNVSGSKSVKRLIQEMESKLPALIQNRLEPFRKQLEKETEQAFHDESSRLTQKVVGEVNQFRKMVSGLFDIPFEEIQHTSILTMESRFYYLLEDNPVILEVDYRRVWSLLPQNISRRLVMDNISEKISEWMDRNCGRIRHDLVERLQKSTTMFSEMLSQRMDSLEKNIIHLIDQGFAKRRQNEAQFQSTKQEWMKKKGDYREIKKQLDKLSACCVVEPRKVDLIESNDNSLNSLGKEFVK